jgi:hypothetical protein
MVIEDKWRGVGKWCCGGCGIAGKGAIGLAGCIARFSWAVKEEGMLYWALGEPWRLYSV